MIFVCTEYMYIIFHIIFSLCFIASGEIVRTELAEASNAVALDNLTSVADGLERIQFELTEIDLLTQRLQENSKKLNMG